MHRPRDPAMRIPTGNPVNRKAVREGQALPFALRCRDGTTIRRGWIGGSYRRT